MKWIAAFTMVLSMTNVFAEVSHERVESMLDQMVKENVISAVEAEKAKIRMKTMNPEQWAMINKQATVVASRMPASVNTPSENRIEEVHKIDLDGAQFKAIQSEVKKILPQF
jgi:hypothetical protein